MRLLRGAAAAAVRGGSTAVPGTRGERAHALLPVALRTGIVVQRSTSHGGREAHGAGAGASWLRCPTDE